MNERELMNRLEEAVPEVPSVFHNAMLGAFAQIQEQEAQESKVVELPRPKLRKRTAAVVLIAALFMASVAAASAFIPHMLYRFFGRDMSMREDLPSIVLTNVAEHIVGNCRVRMDEVLYDGVALYFNYTVRNMDVDRMMGIEYPDDPPGYRRYLTFEEEEQEIYTWDAYLWRDSIWINGEEIHITSATFDTEGGDEPGEYMTYYIYWLDAFNVELHGNNRITLPIGRDPRKDYEHEQIPADENGNIPEPEGDAALTFYLDADIPDMAIIEDNPATTWADGTQVQVVRAVFSPLRLYLTLDFTPSEAALEAFLQEYEFAKDWEPESLKQSIGIHDCWDLCLVDADGKLLYRTNTNDCRSETNNGLVYLSFPYQTYGAPLYLALSDEDGNIDMSTKITIKE